MLLINFTLLKNIIDRYFFPKFGFIFFRKVVFYVTKCTPFLYKVFREYFTNPSFSCSGMKKLYVGQLVVYRSHASSLILRIILDEVLQGLTIFFPLEIQTIAWFSTGQIRK